MNFPSIYIFDKSLELDEFVWNIQKYRGPEIFGAVVSQPLVQLNLILSPVGCINILTSHHMQYTKTDLTIQTLSKVNQTASYIVNGHGQSDI